MKSLKSPSSSFSNFQAPEQTPQLAYRPFGGQTQKASFTPVTQTDVENEAFAEEKMEVTGLELQAKYRTITPEGQERLTVLQAKMDRSLNSRLEKATRFGHNFANIPVRRPDTPTPIQAKLTIGEPGDRYEQEADQTARQVMQRIHQPESEQLQREELPDEEELQMKPESSIQREELPEEEEEEVQIKSWGETPLLQREELPEEELQMKPLGTSSQTGTEVQSSNKPLGHDISRISLRRPQTKLTVNQPGDIYEQEADSVANLVMQRMSEPVSRQSIQREALPEEEDQLQMKSLAGSITPLVQRQGGGRTAATSELETSIQQARGNGQPLADDIKQPMEQAFGADFGSVRVHTDAQSDSLNQSIQARAFTTGQDVFFRQGEYSPGSNAGKELLAHELTHVVQQNGSAVQPKSLHVAPKENKLQTKVPTTSVGHGLAIQLRENFQKPTDENNQKNLEAVESKTDTENGEQQNQAKAEKHQASPTPPDDGGNGATDPPPTKKVVAAVTQKQIEAGGNQAKEPDPKDTKVSPEKVDSQQQAQSKGADVAKGAADLPGGNAGKAIAALPGTNVASTADDGKKAPTSPEDDPAFQAVAGTTKEVAGLEKKHPPANSKAQEAQAAAQPPGNEVDSKAQANQVGEMQQAPTPGFDAAAFKAKLMERIADMAPKNLEEADNFKNNNKLDSVKGDLSGQVKEEQKSSQGQLEEKTKEKPDASGIEAKQVTPLPKNEPGKAPTGVDADKAAPKSKGQAEVEAPLQDDSKKLDQQMKEADITEEQLANSNEPEFQGALAAKKDAQTNAVEAPPQYRQQEQGILATAQATAEATAQQHLQAMHGIRTQNLGQVGEQQIGAKSKDEQARAKVAGDINKIYDKTKGKVEKTLGELDGQVIQAFDAGAADAKKAFEDYVGKRMDDYKSDRYSGFLGPAKWLKDKLFGMPSEVNAFYQEGRQLYINQMDGVINKVVAIISKGLTQAKAEIANGKQEIQNYVNQLPQELKGVGQQAAADIDSKFEELQQSVDDKQDQLIDTLAQKYQENLEAVDARIEEMKAANKGFIQKAFDFIVGVIKTIIELTKMLLQVLARVAGVVGQILKDPIGFLTNLIQALKQGFLNFMNNIGKHLQQGLIGWLTGTMAETGIEMPENFDLKGIFSLAMQLLGFTYETIRAQAVKRLGEEKVSRLEQSVDVFQVLASEGVAGMWEFVQEKMGDLNALVIEPIKNFIIEKVITAGIEWILSLLTPASAFIKAAKAIYEIVKFFIERAQQIADLINAILDAIGAIASGAIDQAIKGVENALAKSLPVVISFLASLLGLDGIADKVQAIFRKLRKPMEKAVDWVIDKGAKAFKKVGNKVKNSKFGKKAGKLKDSAKEKYKAGKQWVEDKKEAAHNWVEEKKGATLRGTDPRTQEQKSADLHAALKKAEKIGDNDELSLKEVKNRIQIIKNNYRMQYLKLIVDKHTTNGDIIHFEGKINPDGKSDQVEHKINDERFDKLVYEALKQLGAKHYKGYTKSKYITTDLYNNQEANIRSQRPSSPAKGEEADIRSQRPSSSAADVDSTKAIDQDKEVISKLQSEKQKEVRSLSNNIHQQLAKAQIAYSTASMAKYYPNNVFGVGNGKFFVEQAINYYIAPANEVGENYEYYDINELNKSPKQYKALPKINGIPKQSEGFKIGSTNKVGTKYPYKKLELDSAKTKLKEFPNSITNDEESTLFIAAMLAEPSRYSVAHITNLLVLSNSELGTDTNIFNKLSMTQQHSDPTGGATDSKARATTKLKELETNYPQVKSLLEAKSPKGASKEEKEAFKQMKGLTLATSNLVTDERIGHEDRPKIVTDRDLAAVKENSQLMGQLHQAFANHENIQDAQLIETFKTLISNHLQLE
ncbi:eCIS core domain-containing protein [Nostoc sp.]|uniref:eCIS core domain-containing protein n=1 Tax=Nostoc sp. TaxID=1180 RepID=UPI002FF54CF3